MREPNLQGCLRYCRIAITFLICCCLFASTMFFFLCISSPVFASSPQISIHSSNLSAGPDPQQILSEAQNDVTIANTIISFTGIFFGIIAVASVFVGFFEIRGLRGVQLARAQVDEHVKQVSIIEGQIKEQLQLIKDHSDSNVQNFNQHIEQLTKKFEQVVEKFEEQLQGLSERFENENQRFMEISYNFNAGMEAYKLGNNTLAIHYYQQALVLKPNNAKILERLGRAYNNIADTKMALHYLEMALALDPSNTAVLRGLALCYRYSDKDKSVEYLERCLAIFRDDYEALDFLGLIYRDQGLIDEAISTHEKALALYKRPETEFYLSILYAQKGDQKTAYLMALLADRDTYKQEHEVRLRQVWKLLMHAGLHIMEEEKDEALQFVRTLSPYITSKPIHNELTTHLRLLLKATNHEDWLPEFMDLLVLRTS